MVHPTDIELGYFAGMIDGEGSIFLTVNNNKKLTGKNGGLGFSISPRVVISNTNIESLRAIQSIFGGKIIKKHHTNKKWRQGYEWQIRDIKRCFEILDKIYPYLIIKKEKAIIVREYCKLRLCKGANSKRHIRYENEELNILNKLSGVA